MVVTEQDYLVLSKLAYANFKPNNKDDTLDLLANSPAVNDLENAATWKSYLPQMSDWKLINYVNNNDNGGSGYCGAAFQNTKTGKIIITNRGTETDILQYGMGDIQTDIQLALTGNAAGTPNQFADALTFTADTLSQISGQAVDRSSLSRYVSLYDVSYTGHSLGGGLSEFLTYATGGQAVTFNAVGIGQAFNLDQAAARSIIV